MKFIKLHQNGKASLVNLINIVEVYAAVSNKSVLCFNFEVGGDQASFTADESIDEILELIKRVSA